MSTTTTSPSGDALGEESLGRRERKKAATRRAIHRAAYALVQERGLAEVTIEDITERADVAPRTFFNYFPSKEEAVLEREPGRNERLRAALADRPAGEAPLESIRQVFLADLLPKDLSPGELLDRMQLIRSEPTLQALMAAHFEELHEGVSAEIARRTGLDEATSAYPDLLTSATFAAVRTAMFRWATAGTAGGPAAAINEAFALLGAGLTPPVPTPATPTSPEEVSP